MLTEKMWNAIQDIYNAILSHPFIKGLVNGTLDEEKFKYYILQDYLYLREFSKALAIISAKAEKQGEAMLFSSHLQSIMRVENELHNFFMDTWNISEEEKAKLIPSPTNLLYTSFLLSTVLYKPYFEAVSAVLPCYWIYMEVGKELLKKGSPNPLYDRWIKTYGGEEYERGVKAVLEIVNSFKLTQEEEATAIRTFRIASIMEYMFWDSAYKLEKFPFNF